MTPEERKAFKERMKQLKAYRELNPGKGYWDFKAYLSGGETSEPSFWEKLDNAADIADHTLSAAGLASWATPWSRVAHAIASGAVDAYLIGRGIYKGEWGDVAENAGELALDVLGGKGLDTVIKVKKAGLTVRGFYVGRGKHRHFVPARTQTTEGEAFDQAVKLGIVRAAPNMASGIMHYTYTDAQWNKKLKALEEQKDSVKAYYPGGETGDDNKQPHSEIPIINFDPKGDPYNPLYGYNPGAGYLLNPFSLVDALNFTPVGDAIAAKDTYDAVTNNDWLGAGLAAIGMLPLVPNIARYAKSSYRYIPTVNRSSILPLIDAIRARLTLYFNYLTDVANEKNRVFESLRTVPFLNRAKKVDEIYGTDYQRTYDTVNNLYDNDFFKLPEVTAKDMESRGRMLAKPAAVKKFNETGVGAGPEDFELQVNPKYPLDPEQMSTHELNHYIDFIISRNADASKNNKMLRELEKDLKKTDDYFSKGTELKAYMNLLRTKLKLDGIILDLDEHVSAPVLKKYIEGLSDKDPIKRAFDLHKSIKSYAKWFNTIPLAGLAATPMINKSSKNKDKQ